MPRRLLLVCAGLALALSLATIGSGCAAPAPEAAPADVITVEGEASMRGAEPFSVLVLVTPDRNHYVLTFPPDAERPSNPARLRATGRLYLDDWNGQPFAHLRVDDWVRVER